MTTSNAGNENATRTIGSTDIAITPVAMGCWPIAGMTSIDVNDADSLKTLSAALDAGINFFDTAYCYGANGESEKLISLALKDRRDDIVIATKCGIHWDDQLQRHLDARPDTLHREIDVSLKRLATDHVELLYLHAPDPQVPVSESAGALKQILESGKARTIGVSNFNVQQLETFQAECPISAVQPPFNMLQQQIVGDIIPWCVENGASAIIYWPLMKGLLAGKLSRDHVFPEKDGRAKYPMFKGEEWRKNQDFLDVLRGIATTIGKTVSQVVINWTIHRPGITAALCGAKRDWQIIETAGALGWQLDESQIAEIDHAIADRGEPIVREAV